MSSSTKKIKSKSKHSRSWSSSDLVETASSRQDETSSHEGKKQSESKKSNAESDQTAKASIKSNTFEKEKKMGGSAQLKSLVTIPLPSSSSALSIEVSKSSETRPQVVQYRTGLAGKASAAKSLMDLQFDDKSLIRRSLPNENKKKKAGLLPDPVYDLSKTYHVLSKQKSRFDLVMDDKELWPSMGKDRLKLRRSWTEITSTPTSIFNSNHIPLVIESEPLSKVRKTSKSPMSLLDSQLSPYSSVSGIQGPSPVRQKVPQPDTPRPDRQHSSSQLSSSLADSRPREAVPKQNIDKIVSIGCNKKRTSVILVIPVTQSKMHLHGLARVSVLKGKVTVMGHSLVPGTSYGVFSPSTSCLLSLHVDPTHVMTKDDVKAELKYCVRHADEIEGLSKKSIAILKVEKLNSVICDYLITFPQFTKLFMSTIPSEMRNSSLTGVSLFNDGCRIAPEQEMSIPCMKWSDSYNKTLDKWLETVDKSGSGDESPVFVSCGAKNAGKSMLNRCTLNTTLNRVPEVAYIDCDIGQTEFSPPATISLHIISKPVFSVPFCHQRTAEKMIFYGDVTPAQDPGLYVKCVHEVYKAYELLAKGKKLPLIVNTMGFPTGIGLMLFVDTLNIVRPDFVVQLQSPNAFSNFPPVTRELIALDEGWIYNKCPVHVMLYIPTLQCFPALLDDNPWPTHNPTQSVHHTLAQSIPPSFPKKTHKF